MILTHVLWFLAVLWLLSPVLLFAAWLIVAAVMKAKIEGRLTPVAEKIGYVFYFVGYGLDIFVNLFVLFVYSGFEFPREFTVSARLKRWVRADYGWRTRLGWWFADNFIDPFYWIPGKYHIRPNE